jgi:hypothetical protein
MLTHPYPSQEVLTHPYPSQEGSRKIPAWEGYLEGEVDQTWHSNLAAHTPSGWIQATLTTVNL